MNNFINERPEINPALKNYLLINKIYTGNENFYSNV